MPNPLHRMDTLEITKSVWDTFGELTRSEKASYSYFELEGLTPHEFSPPTSVYEISI
jgi:hypothetical protein